MEPRAAGPQPSLGAGLEAPWLIPEDKQKGTRMFPSISVGMQTHSTGGDPCALPIMTRIHSPNPNFDLRYRRVLFAQQHGIRQAARQFDTTRNTVRQ